MQRLRIAAALALVMMSAAFPAQACTSSPPVDLDDIRYADVVVIGRIANYRIVLDPVIREEYRRRLAQSPALPPAPDPGYLSDYASFDVVVDEVLIGPPSANVAVTWDNSTFEEPPSMPSGPFLIALRNPSSRTPPLRGASATILPSPEPQSLTVLQAPCSDAFIFESGSEQAGAIRRILARRRTSPGVR